MTTEAEQNVIGALLIDQLAHEKVSDYLTPGDFENHDHREAYKEILEMVGEGVAVDLFLLTSRCKSKKINISYIGGIQKNTPSSANILHYAKIIKNSSITRKLIDCATQITELATSDKTISEKIDKAQSLACGVEQDNKQDGGAQRISSLLAGCIDTIDERFKSDGKLIGLSTGYIDIDRMLNGLKPGNMVIIAGRPSMGKTTLATNIAFHAGMSGEPVLIFELEMSSSELMDRELSSTGNILHNNIKTGNLEDDDWTKLTTSIGKLRDSPIFIDETPALTINEIKTRSRKCKRENGLSLVVIDYIQLMSGSGDNRNEIVSDMSRSIKSMAKELNVPVIVLSQLNRSVEQRSNKRPTMSDLRDSGSLEQDADIIMFLYRDEVYNEDSPMKGIAELIVSKQRNGATGTVHLTFRGEKCRFDNFAGTVPVIATKQKKWNKGFDQY